MIAAVAASLVAAAVSVASVDVRGEVTDVVAGVVGGKEVVVVASTVDGKGAGKGGPVRRLSVVDRKSGVVRDGPAVPDDATGFGVCGGGVVFVTADGVEDDHGNVVVAAASLFFVADPAALFAVDVCAAGDRSRVVAVRDGLVVADVADGVVVSQRLLPFPARAKSYAGRAARSLRGERGYGQALSLYAPRLFSVDVDGDGDVDLVALADGRLALFRRDTDGLSTTGETRDLYALVGADADADLRVRFAGPRAIVSVSKGAVPEKSRVVVVGGSKQRPFSVVERTWTHDGLAVLLGERGGVPVVGRVDTSLVALSGVVLTGRVGVHVSVGDDNKLDLTAAADIRAGKMDGALPVVDVDVDGDGSDDLVDLGEAGVAVVYQGKDGGYEGAVRVVVPRFSMVVPLSNSLALVAQPTKQKATLTLLSSSSSAPSSSR